MLTMIKVVLLWIFSIIMIVLVIFAQKGII